MFFYEALFEMIIVVFQTLPLSTSAAEQQLHPSGRPVSPHVCLRGRYCRMLKKSFYFFFFLHKFPNQFWCSSCCPGRYNKFCRSLPQTPWVIDGERRMESSVEELIAAPVLSSFRADGESTLCVCSSQNAVELDNKLILNLCPGHLFCYRF